MSRTILLMLFFSALLLVACGPYAEPPVATPTAPRPGESPTALPSATVLPEQPSATSTARAPLPAPTTEPDATATPHPTQTMPPAPPATATPLPGDTGPFPEDGTPLRIQFPPGATSDSVSGTLTTGQKQGYLFRAQAGQLATVLLASTGDHASFVVTGVEDGLFHKSPNDPARHWTAQLPLSQDYLITVAASADTAYELELTVEPLPADLPPPRPTLTTLVEALVRVGPGSEFDAVHALPPGATADVLGRTADNAWFAISGPQPDHQPHVWVAAGDVDVNGDLELLVPVFDAGPG